LLLTGCSTAMAWRTPEGSTPVVSDPAVPNQNRIAAAFAGRPKAAGRADPGLNRTSFDTKLTRDQQYNAHLELGRFQESQENFDFALSEYQKALEACEPRTPILGGVKAAEKQALAHRRMAAALDRLGRFEQSEIEYKTALKLRPNDPKVWNDAGYSYYLQSRWADAERALKTADSLDPNNNRILTNLGLTLAASGKTTDALAAFTRAGGHAVGHANLAYILAAMGQNDQAVKHYKLALEYQPELTPASEALAAIEAKMAQASQIARTANPAALLAANPKPAAPLAANPKPAAPLAANPRRAAATAAAPAPAAPPTRPAASPTFVSVAPRPGPTPPGSSAASPPATTPAARPAARAVPAAGSQATAATRTSPGAGRSPTGVAAGGAVDSSLQRTSTPAPTAPSSEPFP
jgi:Flp pilus assembly protein TadD